MWSDNSLWFWFAFPWWLVTLSVFSCIGWPSVCLVLKNVYSSPLSILNSDCLCFICCWALYILDVNPFINFGLLTPDIWFVNIFSHSVGCLFHFVGYFFCFAEAFQFYGDLLVYFCFWCQTQKIIAKTSVKNFTAHVFF